MPSHYDKKPNGAGPPRQGKIGKIPKIGKIGMIGAILKKVGSMLGSSKARRLDDRRKDDKGIEYRLGTNGHEPRFKLSTTKGNLDPRVSDWIRSEGGSVKGRRYRKDRRRKSKFAIEKRKARDRGEMALKVAVPAGAISVAAGAYSRKNKDKNNGKVEAGPDFHYSTTSKLRQLKPHEIKDMFHSGIENPRTNPPARTKLSKVSKEKARRDRINTERILRMKR